MERDRRGDYKKSERDGYADSHTERKPERQRYMPRGEWHRPGRRQIQTEEERQADVDTQRGK